MANVPLTFDTFVELTEGLPLEAVLSLLREMMSGDEAEDAANTSVKHIAALTQTAQARGIGVHTNYSRPCFDMEKFELFVPAPVGPAYYVAALHEFGHAFGPGQQGMRDAAEGVMLAGYGRRLTPNTPGYAQIMRCSVDAEIGAWEWAITNAKVWTPEMSHSGIQAFCSYLPKEILAGPARPVYFAMLEKIARGK